MLNKTQGLCQRLRSQPNVVTRWIPDDSYVAACISRWLSDESGLCRFPQECKAKVAGNPQTCSGYRCDAPYWRGHNEDVGRIMVLIAPFVGGDSSQYRIAGLLHDVDYLQVPHDRKDVIANAMESDVHPSLLVEDLASRGAPLDMVLAILEHAPHSRLHGVEMSSISQVLYFADNFATCKSAGCVLGEEPYARPKNMPVELWNALIALEIASIQDADTATVGRWMDAVDAIDEVFAQK